MQYKEHYKYKYLLKEFKNDNNQVIIDTPNRVWATDITYSVPGASSELFAA